MTRSRLAVVLALSLTVATGAALRADIRTDQKTRFQLGGVLGRVVNIFGGRAAREGVTSTVALKGNRRATMNDSTGQIVDLDAEKVYDLDLKRRNYKATTFADLRRQMEEAQRKAEEEARKAQRETEPTRAENAPDAKQKEVEVDFDLKSTDQTKTINAFNTRQTIVTITVREKGQTLEQSGGVVMTADMWLAPAMPEMKELQEFALRFAEKLYGPMIAGASAQEMASALAMYPQMKEAMARMAAEAGRIEGTPVLTTTTFDAVKSVEQMAQEAKAGSSDSAEPPPTSIGGLLGGIGRRAAKKSEPPSSRATFLTTSSELLKMTSDVGVDAVAIPAGFKERD